MKYRLASMLLPTMLLLGGCTAISSTPPTNIEQTVSQQTIDPYDLEQYGVTLTEYVNEQGLVNYDELQGDRAPLDQFNVSLNEVLPSTYDNWSESEQIAFWINAYNSLTLASIVDQTPLKSSIRDIPGVWRIRKHSVMGDFKTLDAIEHSILRKDFNEPRIHAALVCAAMSCPPLRSEPFTGDALDAQLDDQVNQWLTGEHGLEIDREKGIVSISAIFDWFGKDWEVSYGTTEGFAGTNTQKAVLNFISNYVDEDDAAYLQGGDYQVKYLDYDWSLNKQ
ncbi:MAG: DUF547 domain-containing protein [Cyanobacteria bacterium P01_F01_bin.150]